MSTRSMNQVEGEIERHVLSQTKKLSDNTFDKIFIRNARGEGGMFSYNCRLCSVANLSGEKSLQTHITGKKHQQRLVYDYVPDATQFRAQLVPPIKAPPTVYPGEPVPPGFENEIQLNCYLDSIIINIEKPLIGLEYVAELHDPKAKEPLYICLLCDKRCDPRNIIAQVTSHRHRMKYLDFHFPTLMVILNRDRRFNTDMTYREEVLTHIARQLEQRFKRQKLLVYEYREYERKKIQINEEVKIARHFNEKDFPENEKILLQRFEINEFEAVSSSDEFDEISEGREHKKKRNHGDIRPFETKNRGLNLGRYASTSISNITSYPHIKYPSSSTSFSTKEKSLKILTPRELSEQANIKMQERYVIEKYRSQLDITTKELQQQLKNHERNPEKHPKYSDEWKAFWQKRYKELIAEGKDANGHDYKPEWITFWMQRMKELYEIDLDQKRKEFRKKFSISVEQANKIEDELIMERNKSPSTNRVNKKRSRSPQRRRSRSPIEISDESSDSDSFRHRRRRSRTPTRYRYSRSKSPEMETELISLVSVCRLLSVLENELGMLAPRILDLLSRGVAMEKKQPNSCDDLMHDNDNMILMETAREKLKGGLSAGLIQSHRMAPVRRAITYIAKLIHEVNKKAPKVEAIEKKVEKIQIASASVSSAEDIAKNEIARVVSQVLAEQGRTDVSAEELESLIESFLSENLNENDKVVEEKVEVPPPEAPKKEESTYGLENLTDDDLKTLLRNFSELTSDEQSHLITYLSKIEKSEPSRVEKLRKYVDIGDEEINEDENDVEMVDEKKKSPEKKMQPVSDDDYDDEQILKSVNGGLNGSPMQKNTIMNDNSMLANDLLNSLMQSTATITHDTWVPTQPYFEAPAYSFTELQMRNDYYNQMAAMQNTAPWPQTASPWPQTAASSFVNDLNKQPYCMPGPSNPQPSGSGYRNETHDHVPFRKRIERTNNLQLTGKGKSRPK